MNSLVDTRPHSVFPQRIYLGAATRSPIGKFGGALKRFSAAQLATLVLKEALSRAPEAALPDWVILGHARQAGGGPNTARQATFFSGLPSSVPAITLNQACASGMAAIFSGVEKIALGRATSVWAGGTESMSNTPYLLPQFRWGHRMGHTKILDGMVQDGFHCPMADMLMGETVERFLAKDLHISREQQDAFALESQQKAHRAWKNGNFHDETFEIFEDPHPPTLKPILSPVLPILSEDEHRRADISLASLSKLPPVFDSLHGTVTAGNSSGITDGAAWIHLSSIQQSHALAEVLDFETVAIDPKLMGLGPVSAVQKLLGRHGLRVQDLEAVELNEAFAAQVLACQTTLKIPSEKLNPNGGAIALGHPIGATGARILVTLLHCLKNKPGSLGIATLCVSGGQGVAILVKSLH